MVLIEWPEGSEDPGCLKGDVGLSFCSPSIQRAMLALMSSPTDSVISLEAFAHRRCNHQQAAHNGTRASEETHHALHLALCNLLA